MAARPWLERFARVRAPARAADPADQGTAFGLEMALAPPPTDTPDDAARRPARTAWRWWRARRRA